MKIFIALLFTLALFGERLNDLALQKIELLEQNSSKSFAFAFLGDNRGGCKIYQKILKKINQDKEISFIINGGDLVPNGYKKQYKSYLECVKISKKPIINIIGNHEVKWSKGEKYFEKFIGDRYFSFSFRDAYFIILDSSNQKALDKKQLSWLKKELNLSLKFKHRFVFMHTPLYDPREGVLKRGHSLKDLNQAKELNLLFKRYRVSLLFCSHIHLFFDGEWRGVKFIISGGGGAPLYYYKDRAFFHYIKVDVNSSSFDYKVIKIDAQDKPKWRWILQRAGEYLNIW